MIPWEIQGAEEMHLFGHAGSGEVDERKGKTEWGIYRPDASPPSLTFISQLTWPAFLAKGETHLR